MRVLPDDKEELDVLRYHNGFGRIKCFSHILAEIESGIRYKLRVPKHTANAKPVTQCFDVVWGGLPVSRESGN